MKRLDWLKEKIEELRENPTDECVEWPFTINYKGYGYVFVSRGVSNFRVHRLAYEFYHGHAPHQWVLHHCDNRKCFNPRHLYDGSPKQNIADAITRGRFETQMNMVRTHKGRPPIVTKSEVYQMLEMQLSGLANAAIGKRFGVSYETVKRYTEHAFFGTLDSIALLPDK